jgi:hypothetical protein
MAEYTLFRAGLLEKTNGVQCVNFGLSLVPIIVIERERERERGREREGEGEILRMRVR